MSASVAAKGHCTFTNRKNDTSVVYLLMTIMINRFLFSFIRALFCTWCNLNLASKLNGNYKATHFWKFCWECHLQNIELDLNHHICFFYFFRQTTIIIGEKANKKVESIELIAKLFIWYCNLHAFALGLSIYDINDFIISKISSKLSNAYLSYVESLRMTKFWLFIKFNFGWNF